MQVIVYTNDINKISIISCAPNCGLTIEEIAEKDTPLIVLERDYDGTPIKTEPRQYFIVDDLDLPDRELRDRWVIAGGKVIVGNSISLAPAFPNWELLYSSLLSGNLCPVFNSVTQQAIANPAIAVGLIHVNSAIAQVKVEQALADALVVLQLSGFTFSDEFKALWNKEVKLLSFSDLVNL